MINYAFRIAKLAGALLFSLILLSAFCLIYWYSPGGVSDTTGSTSWKYPSGSYVAKMNEGFSIIHFDENGYNNVVALENPVDILLMGSSHMEALQVPVSENTASILELEYFPNKRIYNIGVSGHDFLQCLTHVQSAYMAYSPTEYIIIETSSVQFVTKTLDSVLNGKDYSKDTSGGIRKLLKKIPIWSSFYTQITSWRDAEGSVPAVQNGTIGEEYKEKLNQIFRQKTEGVGCGIIVFFHPIENLESDGTISFNIDETYLSAFRQACENCGIVFVDMTSEIERLYYSEHVLAHGFINTAVGSGHLNKYGHQAIAERLSQVIMEGQQP